MAAGQDKVLGGIISLVSLLLIGAWLYVMWYMPDINLQTWQWLGLKLFSTVIVVIVLLIVLWVGHTIATTPSIEELQTEAKKQKKR